MLGEKRFWKTAAELQLEPTMEEFLNYYGRGQLASYKMSNQSLNADVAKVTRP